MENGIENIENTREKWLQWIRTENGNDGNEKCHIFKQEATVKKSPDNIRSLL